MSTGRARSTRIAPQTRRIGHVGHGLQPAKADILRAANFQQRREITTERPAPPGRGYCPQCHTAVLVRTDGTLRTHAIPGVKRRGYKQCAGSGAATEDAA